ncbi:hypothetical protein P3L10_012452 [Capsicum annuum]
MNMQIKQSLVILFFLSLLFVSAAMKNNTLEKHEPEEEQRQPQHNWKVMRHSLDLHMYFSSKRRVPNESDPLHNR